MSGEGICCESKSAAAADGATVGMNGIEFEGQTKEPWVEWLKGTAGFCARTRCLVGGVVRLDWQRDSDLISSHGGIGRLGEREIEE